MEYLWKTYYYIGIYLYEPWDFARRRLPSKLQVKFIWSVILLTVKLILDERTFRWIIERIGRIVNPTPIENVTFATSPRFWSSFTKHKNKNKDNKIDNNFSESHFQRLVLGKSKCCRNDEWNVNSMIFGNFQGK